MLGNRDPISHYLSPFHTILLTYQFLVHLLHRERVHLQHLLFRNNMLQFFFDLTNLPLIPATTSSRTIIPPPVIFHIHFTNPLNPKIVLFMSHCLNISPHCNHIPILNFPQAQTTLPFWNTHLGPSNIPWLSTICITTP